MAGDVSIRVRAVDMTRAVFGRITAGLRSMSAGLSGVIQSGSKVGSLLGGLTGGIAIRSIALHMREIADAARETGNYDIISKRQVDNISGAAKFMSMMKDAAASLVASGIDALFGGGGSMGELGRVADGLSNAKRFESSTIGSEISKVEDAKGIAAASAYITQLLKTQTDQAIINDLIEKRVQLTRKAADEERRSSNDKKREAKELAELQKKADSEYVDSEKALSDANYARLSTADKIAQKGWELADAKQAEAAASDPLTRWGKQQLNLATAKRMAIEDEIKALQEGEKKAKQSAFSARVNLLSSSIQSEGRAFFDASNSRRISSRASAAMGERINRLTGDDQTKYQMQTASILAQIYRMLGGTGGR